ncbi:hypothetical protein B0H66DRAFT_607812 [Apodospora peruviana]|uniref:NACHT domain-containing protein n=1 Tax=Apodospora peruviana TaxID=516989 RepID=A0AAE0LYV8_9PEZI|nr:hypothetical protein B0H66DRAFT_607812 [Apodospora peruviana]
MDPMSALAVAAAAIQFVDFGGSLLGKSWSRYKRATSAETTSDISKQLSSLKVTLHDASDRLLSQRPTIPERQLLDACALCDKIESEFQAAFGNASNRSYSPSLVRRFWEQPKIDQMDVRLQALKGLVMEAFILCIWEDTRESRKRDQQFTTQITNVLDTLKRIEEKTIEQSQSYKEFPDRPARSLAEVSNHISLADMADYVRSTLAFGDQKAMREMRSDLQKATIANMDWKPDPSMSSEPWPHETFMDRNISSVARIVCESFHFEAFEAREAAIADSIMQTYSWIYDRHPIRPDGEPVWSSFPDWLEGPSDPTYWITGKPGSGKSTILKHILKNPALRDHLGKWARDDRPLVIASYYAWNAGTTLQKSIQGLKRTLLSQVLAQYPGLLPMLVPRRWAYFMAIQGVLEMGNASDWEVDESFGILLSLAGKNIYLAIFIDGLDEFDVHPKEVVSLIEVISSASSGDGVKICVASRPWVEFDDAYRDVPKLQMDLFTHADMKTYVLYNFSGCRALSDLRKLYPIETAQLEQDIAQKANGVFIWLKVVVDALMESATEGAGISELQGILESLPSNISQLYDAIWARIPEHNRRRGAVLLRLVQITADYCQLNWSLAWLADEYAFRQYDDIATEHTMISGVSMETDVAFVNDFCAILKRKLASRTRGLLEIGRPGNTIGTNEGVVNFTHRTAQDWARGNEVLDGLIQQCGDSFDPYLFLVEMFTIWLTPERLQLMSKTHLWEKAIEPTLWYGSRITTSGPSQNIDKLVRALDVFGARVDVALAQRNGRSVWTGSIPLTIRENDFVGLAARFAILPYLQAKAAEDERILFRLRGTSRTPGILESAVLGYRELREDETFTPGSISTRTTRKNQDIHCIHAAPLRLETVRFLIDQGVEQYSMSIPGKWETVSLREEARKIMAVQNVPTGFQAKMFQLLGDGLRVSLRMAAMRLKLTKLELKAMKSRR